MRMSYSTAADRAARGGSRSGGGPRTIELLGLLAATLITAAGLFLVHGAKAGRWGDIAQDLTSGRKVNLNDVSGVPQITPLLSGVGGTETERRFIAERIYRFVNGVEANGGGRRHIERVGSLTAITVTDREVMANPRLTSLRDRLARQREPQGAGHDAVAMTVPLLSGADLAALGPSFVVRTPADFRQALLLGAAILFAGFYAAHLVLRLRRGNTDNLLLPIVHLLCGIGLVAMVALRDPLRDALLFVPFAEGAAAGSVVMAACALVDFQRLTLRKLSYVPLAAAIALSFLLIVFGSGPGTSDAKVNLLGVQPVEAIRLLVVLFLAGYFANRWEFLRSLREPGTGPIRLARWFDVPRLDYVVPVLAGMALVLVFFFLQKDLGPALVLSCVFLALYGVARNRVPMVIVGLLVLVAGFGAGYLLGFPHTVVQRIGMWRSPWENGLRGGDQVAHALWALSSGGLAGTGLGLGEPHLVPAGHTDLILSVVGEELGFLGLLAVFVLYGTLGYRAIRIARRAVGDYSFFLALGLTLSLLLQLFLIAAGQVGLMPLTGVVTPFLSYGRSSMLANFAAIGMLLAIGERVVPKTRNRDFDRPLRWVVGVVGVLLAVVLGRTAIAQVLRSDQTAAAAVLAVQADGARRYEYNPRLLAAARQIDRGDILDRNGIPIATSRPAGLDKHRADLERLGVQVDKACPRPDSRCYPFGGMTFHLLGDLRTRVNWGAGNTSFEERDGDARLRGYDDHAQIVEVTDPRTGAVEKVIRRNYRELLPLWRYRFRPGQEAVTKLLERNRDVKMSIDVRLQMRVADALKARIERAGKSKGAAVVLDENGDVLAAVSYPWPALSPVGIQAVEADLTRDTDDPALMDRARYGMYPPGSSFKVVTATAALRKDPALEGATFICERLPDGRVGQRIKGWGRPIRDDPSDTVPHGTLDLPHALVVSCNAYFAQLGLRLGAAALLETARLFEIPLGQPESPAVLRDTLPFAAYGQGQVLATPFKMARVAATMAAGGMMPYGRWVIDDTNAEPPRAILPASLARRLAHTMRDVVLNGTGRSVKAIDPPIAGKTGTAEVKDAPSHSWFIGFAPYGDAAGHRIAFAVLVENGGYGASIAAPIAGDIVTAARELGIVK
jgi:cell division protein FtsW (lipid II flippase)/cell division protein FtsI/penicillin-binding protein 2